MAFARHLTALLLALTSMPVLADEMHPSARLMQLLEEQEGGRAVQSVAVVDTAGSCTLVWRVDYEGSCSSDTPQALIRFYSVDLGASEFVLPDDPNEFSFFRDVESGHFYSPRLFVDRGIPNSTPSPGFIERAEAVAGQRNYEATLSCEGELRVVSHGNNWTFFLRGEEAEQFGEIVSTMRADCIANE
ncbi:MAG: hypothetical protein AAF590_14085 [Pseudomonadota bacterium]